MRKKEKRGLNKRGEKALVKEMKEEEKKVTMCYIIFHDSLFSGVSFMLP